MKINNWNEFNTLICKELNWEVGNIREGDKFIKVYTPAKYVEYRPIWLEQQTHWLLGHPLPQFAFSYDDMSLLILESSKPYKLLYEMKADCDEAWCKILKRPDYTKKSMVSSRVNNELPNSLPLIVSLAFLKYRNIELEGTLHHSGIDIKLENIVYY